MNKHFKFNDEHLKFVEENVVGRTNNELKDLFNERFNTSLSKLQISNFKKRNNLSSGLDGKFKKGAVSWNKGKNMSDDVYKMCKPTMFKKGSIPPNKRPIGSERIAKNGYIEIKYAEGLKKWKSKHKYLYEKYKGEVPKNHVVIFADGNIRNFDIDNLVLVSRKELLYLNQHHLIYNDCELTKTGVLIAKLSIAAKEKEKE